MQINPEIIERLKKFGINKDDGLCYLLSVYYYLDNVTVIPNLFKAKVLATSIFKVENGNAIWSIPLFENEVSGYDFVKTYIEMFKNVSNKVPGSVTESTVRFQKFFRENPDVTVQNVLDATELYLKEVDPNYIMFPHYFITKGTGTNRTSMLSNYVDRIKEENIEKSSLGEKIEKAKEKSNEVNKDTKSELKVELER